jgi:hypothetical protein
MTTAVIERHWGKFLSRATMRAESSSRVLVGFLVIGFSLTPGLVPLPRDLSRRLKLPYGETDRCVIGGGRFFGSETPASVLPRCQRPEPSEDPNRHE